MGNKSYDNDVFIIVTDCLYFRFEKALSIFINYACYYL